MLESVRSRRIASSISMVSAIGLTYLRGFFGHVEALRRPRECVRAHGRNASPA